MLDNLINLVKEHAGDAIVRNPDVPNEKNEAVIEETGNSIMGSLQNMVSGGGMNDLLNTFRGSGSGSDDSFGAVSQNVSGDLISNLKNKFGLDQGAASGIAGGMIPNILKSLVNKTNDPNDKSFDLQSILSQLGGGNLQSIIGKVTGGKLDKDGDGDVDLKDIKGMFGM